MSNVAEIITNEILQKLSEGQIPWRRDWITSPAINYISGRPYTGINRLLLDGGQYATYRQITERNGKIKRGAKSHLVVFYKPLTVTEEDENEPKTVRMLRYYRVFNIADTTLEPREIEGMHENYSIENCEKVINDYIAREGITVERDAFSNRAYYSPSTDTIRMPTLSQFEDSKKFYGTFYHELVHTTLAKSRLNRDISTSFFGSESYSREECIAEIGSCLLCNHTGINTAEIFDNSVAYIQGWLKALKDDKNMILYAAAKADKAVEFILHGTTGATA